jgi:hypothetical protein
LQFSISISFWISFSLLIRFTGYPFALYIHLGLFHLSVLIMMVNQLWLRTKQHYLIDSLKDLYWTRCGVPVPLVAPLWIFHNRTSNDNNHHLNIAVRNRSSPGPTDSWFHSDYDIHLTCHCPPFFLYLLLFRNQYKLFFQNCYCSFWLRVYLWYPNLSSLNFIVLIDGFLTLFKPLIYQLNIVLNNVLLVHH